MHDFLFYAILPLWRLQYQIYNRDRDSRADVLIPWLNIINKMTNYRWNNPWFPVGTPVAWDVINVNKETAECIHPSLLSGSIWSSCSCWALFLSMINVGKHYFLTLSLRVVVNRSCWKRRWAKLTRSKFGNWPFNPSIRMSICDAFSPGNSKFKAA